MSDGRPAHIRPISGSLDETEFETPAQEAAARSILEHWSETHNFREIARRTSWSASHIRKVFYEYFEAADEPVELQGSVSGQNTVTVERTHRQELREAFIEGYLTRVREELRGDEPSFVPESVDDT